MKVYTVQTSTGSYEDHFTTIVGIFKDPADAEAFVAEIEIKNKEILDTPNPFLSENLDNFSEEEKNKYWNWWEENNSAEEFNRAYVTEYILK